VTKEEPVSAEYATVTEVNALRITFKTQDSIFLPCVGRGKGDLPQKERGWVIVYWPRFQPFICTILQLEHASVDIYTSVDVEAQATGAGEAVWHRYR